MGKMYDDLNDAANGFARIAGIFSNIAMEMQVQTDRVIYLENENQKLKNTLKQFASAMVDLTQNL